MATISRNKLHLAIVFVLYAIQLVSTSPRIMYDSSVYYGGAMVFAEDGLEKALTKTFPMAEPAPAFFNFLISHLFPGSHWPDTVTIFHFLIIFLCALMAVDLAGIFIRSRQIKTAIFYCIALSPGLMTSALTLYCEVFSMFWFMLAIYLARKAFESTRAPKKYLSGSISALSVGILILSKAAFWYIALFIFISFGFYLVLSKRVKKIQWIGLFTIYVTLALCLPVAWSYRNQRVYGVYGLATRGGLHFASRYMISQEMPYTIRAWLIGTVDAFSDRLGRSLFGDEVDQYNWRRADDLGYEYMKRVNQKYHITETNQYRDLAYHPKLDAVVFREVKSDILSSGLSGMFRFAAFGWFEVLNLVFFETIGYDTIAVKVSWLERIYGFMPLRTFIRIGLSIFYVIGIGMFFFFFLSSQNQRAFKQIDKDFFWVSLFTIFWFFAVYSLSLGNMRYTYPIAPLYIGLALSGWSIYFAKQVSR